METNQFVGIIGGLLSLFAYIPYWRSIYKPNGTRPQRASWLIWIFSDTLLFATSFALGATDSLYVLGAYVFGTVVTFLISIKKGEGGTHWFDIACLLITIVSGFLWWKTGNPYLSLLINLAIVAIGCIPSIIKIVRDPYSEDLFSFVFWTTGSLLGLVSVLLGDIVTIQLLIQPIVFVILQLIIVITIIGKRSIILRNKKSPANG